MFVLSQVLFHAGEESTDIPGKTPFFQSATVVSLAGGTGWT
jgi:hypothetical protein